MPAPFWGRVDPAGALLEQRMMVARQKTLEKGERTRAGQLRAQLELGRRGYELEERKQALVEEQAQRPTFFTAGNSLLAISPTGEVSEAWKVPKPPVVVGMGQALIDPDTGEPVYSPPQLSVTDTEMIVTDTATGEELNRIPINQLPPDTVFFQDQWGNVAGFNPQTNEQVVEYESPFAREMMRRDAKDKERDFQLRETLGKGQLELGVSAERRAWEAMYIDKELAEVANLTEQQRMTLNAALTREGYDITEKGFEINLTIAREANLSSQQINLLNAKLTRRGQDLQYELGVSGQELQEMLGMGELEIMKRAEDRAWQQMYINKNIADQANLTELQRIEINTILTREGYDVQHDNMAIQERIATMGNLTQMQITHITAGLEERRIRIESRRVEAVIEEGKEKRIGDLIIRRNTDGTYDIAFEMPAENYPLTPISIGDPVSGYRVGLINPKAGTIEWFEALPGGAGGTAEVELRIDLLDRAIKTIAPPERWMTTLDEATEAALYQKVMALYSDLLQSELGYSPEKAASLATPVTLWKALGGTTNLTFAGEAPPERSYEMHQKYISGMEYGPAVEYQGEFTPGDVTIPETPGGVKTLPFEKGEVTPQERSMSVDAWIRTFTDWTTPGVPSDAVKALQSDMAARGLWDKEIDGLWTKELERKFAIAYRAGKIELNIRGER